MMPRISNYSNGKPNAVCVELGNVTVWFSYRTMVAFEVEGHPRVVHRNDWSSTTGRHLTAIDGGSAKAHLERVDHETFLRLWQEQTSPGTQIALKG
jgi:hypothetical protein